MIKKTTYFFFLVLVFQCIFIKINAQDRIEEIKNKLTELAKTETTLNSKVNLSVTDVSIQEFVRGIAYSNKVNINIDPSINIFVANNFTNVSVLSVLVFICKEYNLDIAITGNILSIKEYYVEEPEIQYVAKSLKIEYDTATNFLSLDLQNDSLQRVVKYITGISNKNIVLAPGIHDQMVSVYIINKPFDNVLDKFAYANNLVIKKTEDDFYLVEQKLEEKEEKPRISKTGRPTGKKETTTTVKDKTGFDFEIVNDSISILVEEVPIVDIINKISQELEITYFLTSEVKGEISFNSINITYDELLLNLLHGSEYTYKKQNGVYLIGERKMHALKMHKVLFLQYRTVDKLAEFIPEALKKEVEIKEFSELNCLLLVGSSYYVKELEDFIYKIDRVVPVILIEVLIIDISKSRTLSTGIEAGLGESQITSGGHIAPSIDFQLNSESLNNLINSFNGFGWLNLGKVTPNFYLSLKALENDGILKLRSTPKLSTLNGHEASLSIGNTEYYLEEQSNVIGTQNPQIHTSQVYKSVQADLKITFKPFVSGDDQITLEIDVVQSDFTDRISKYAPPGQVSRNFKSLIRVKNEEMILLGGLEDKRMTSSGSGLPFLSRIPVLKWIFSSRTKRNENSKLNIFIKPTIIR